MNKCVMNRLLHVLATIMFVVVITVTLSGCSALDPLGVGRGDTITTGDLNSSNEDSGDFLSSDEVMAFFDYAPGDKINGMYTLLKAVINSTYIDELEMNTAKKGYETTAWRIAYGILNEYSGEDKTIKVQKKKGNFVVDEEAVVEYILSSFAGATVEKSEKIAELLHTYNTMVEYNKKKNQYTMLLTDAAEFNAELVDLKISSGKIEVDNVMVDGAVLTYQLTDRSESKYNLGKVKVTIVKNEGSKFGYSIAKVSYSKKGIGEPTVIVATPAPDATAEVKSKKNK